MFKWMIKNKKPIIVCIHGFGKRRIDEFENLKLNLINYDYIMPNLYDQSNPEDNNYEDWIKRGLDALLEAKKTNRPIILLGFSMGGVIASYYASIIKVDKLILIAPAFDYLNIKTASKAINKIFVAPEKVNSKYIELPKNFTSTFMTIVDKYKDRIYDVTCPTLIIHASEDEVIPYNGSLKIFSKLRNANKKCFILGGGCHRLLDDILIRKDAYCLIDKFIKGTL